MVDFNFLNHRFEPSPQNQNVNLVSSTGSLHTRSGQRKLNQNSKLTSKTPSATQVEFSGSQRSS